MKSLRRLVQALSLTLVLSAPAAAFEMPSEWLSAHFQDNPLVGSLWSGDGRRSDAAALTAALGGADFVLAGEIHTNPDHHAIQAGIVEAWVAAGRRPAVVFEMISADEAPALDTFLARPGATAEGFGAAVKWTERGWPDFAMYRPVVAAAMAHRLPLHAGDLGRETIRRIGREGVKSLPAGEVGRLGLDGPMPGGTEETLTAELKASHCGLLPDEALAPMLMVQRARDGALAKALIEASGHRHGLLIAGAGHVRTDYAVPALLRARKPDATIVSIGMMEVSDGKTALADYGISAATPAPYDFVLFTPRADLADPCEGMAEAMKTMAPAK
ncbi:hypothetical protein Sa4125_39340 [Aureimonas sp. SA4125]|uniref:ChaN family lipoprotein n=1 Tax=Aureimonas sp. SA4125 TaxID=2826993 RepID=UPI001CC70A14|nr:ChaN family lipoprotein [Aureimonas sp. SA4125]BDA86392.1 hypothetical protein Sa4125_39340 [Aureimonas sp. SA4125]